MDTPIKPLTSIISNTADMTISITISSSVQARDFGFQRWETLEFRIPAVGNRTNFGFRRRNFGFQGADFGFQRRHFGFQRRDFGFQPSDFGFQPCNFGFQTQEPNP